MINYTEPFTISQKNFQSNNSKVKTSNSYRLCKVGLCKTEAEYENKMWSPVMSEEDLKKKDLRDMSPSREHQKDGVKN